MTMTAMVAPVPKKSRTAQVLDMAWGGARGRLSGKVVKGMFRKWHRPPPPDCPTPHSIPKSVMRALQSEQLSDLSEYNARLQELLAAYKSNLKG
jgi:hypothetical protein